MHASRRQFLRFAAGAGVGFAGPWAHGQAQPRRAAVIGHTGRGDYGHGLESIFRDRAGIEVVGLADPDVSGRAQARTRAGAREGYADYREMLSREKPQLVSIAMRHADQHHDIGLACLRVGAHCYFEKPFTRSPDEADELLAEAERLGLRIAVAHTMRMTPPVVRLRQAVRDGLLGELRELRAYGKQDARAGGEDMMVLGSHLFDLMRLICGDPTSVAASVVWQGRDITREDRRRVRDDVGWVAGDRVIAQFAFRDGVRATFTSDAHLRETIGHWGIELLGSKGAARINCDIAPNVFVRATTGWSASGRTDTWQPLEPGLVKQPPEHNLGPVDDWLDATTTGREPECSGRNGAWAVEMVAGVYTAALTGSRVTFPLATRTHPLGGG